MKLFVTGGTGFIGSHVLDLAGAAGHQVVALRRSPASPPKLAVRGNPVWLDRAMDDLTEGDFSGVDTLVHLAAAGITPQPATWESCFDFNVIQSLALVRKALKAGVRRIVVAGTYAEYGLAGLRYDKIPANAPLEPTDPYAASKAASSIAFSALCRKEKFELVYARLFSIYGEGQYNQNFWPQLRRAALAGEDFLMTQGNQIRDFMPVDAAASSLLNLATIHPVIPGIPYVLNVASGTPVSLREFAEHWWDLLEAKGSLRVGALPSRGDEVKIYIPLI